MQEHKLLTLRWDSFLNDSSDMDPGIFGLKGGQYLEYVLQRPCLRFDYQTHKTKIIDSSLTVISMTGQQAYHYYVCL